MPQHGTVHVILTAVIVVVMMNLSAAQSRASERDVSGQPLETLVGANRTLYETTRADTVTPEVSQLQDDQIKSVITRAGRRFGHGDSEPAERDEIHETGREPTEALHARGPPETAFVALLFFILSPI